MLEIILWMLIGIIIFGVGLILGAAIAIGGGRGKDDL